MHLHLADASTGCRDCIISYARRHRFDENTDNKVGSREKVRGQNGRPQRRYRPADRHAVGDLRNDGVQRDDFVVSIFFPRLVCYRRVVAPQKNPSLRRRLRPLVDDVEVLFDVPYVLVNGVRSSLLPGHLVRSEYVDADDLTATVRPKVDRARMVFDVPVEGRSKAKQVPEVLSVQPGGRLSMDGAKSDADVGDMRWDQIFYLDVDVGDSITDDYIRPFCRPLRLRSYPHRHRVRPAEALFYFKIRCIRNGTESV